MSVNIVIGDALEQLRVMPDESVHCIVTSPPYYGLRDYGIAGQIGLEPTPSEYVARLAAVFAEARRVLRDDGTLWLNLGDSYAMSTRGSSGKGEKQVTNKGTLLADRSSAIPLGLKAKDLLGIPWRVAFALQADGWYLRQDIIWAKPNPMPESVTDRCTKAHEYVFLLSKSARYYFDNEAVKEQAVSDHPSGNGFKRGARLSYQNADGTARGNDEQWHDVGGKRNRRSVWTVTPKPYKGAHFAVFPPDLIEPCIMAGSPVGGTVLDPFGGSGTTGLVAERHGRNAILIELNPQYAELARQRLAVTPPDAEQCQPLPHVLTQANS